MKAGSSFPSGSKAAPEGSVPLHSSASPALRTPKPNRAVHFPSWPAVLAQSDLPNPVRQSFSVTLRWYLSFCQRSRVAVDFDSARQFVDWAAREKGAEPELIERWREAIRWFFRESRSAAARGIESGGESKPVPHNAGAAPRWESDLCCRLRVLHYSYRTEQSYVGWARRFVSAQGDSLRGVTGKHLHDFLNDLAVRGGVSASTQKQALNALVFFFREVLKQEPGDASGYQRAIAKPVTPHALRHSFATQLLESGADIAVSRTLASID